MKGIICAVALSAAFLASGCMIEDRGTTPASKPEAAQPAPPPPPAAGTPPPAPAGKTPPPEAGGKKGKKSP